MSALGAQLELPCGTVLANRLAKAAMSEQLATVTGRPTPRLVRLYRRWGASGCGLLITGNVMVDRRAVAEPRQAVLEGAQDLDRFRAWAVAARAHGAQCWMQLNHPGRVVPRTLARRPAGPSPVAVRLGGAFGRPRSLTGPEIEEIVRRFGRSAALAVEAGFDGVQIHGAHGYLVSQFLSPNANTRDDDWGGDPQRRRRFLLEVVAAVRGAVGSSVPVAVKLNSSDFQRGGFDEDESMRVVQALGDAEIDLLEISGGTFEAAAMTGRAPVPDRTRAREAYFIDYAERVRRHARMPLMLTGGLRSAEAMQAALSSGAIDLCGIGRPLTVEPDCGWRLLNDPSARSNVQPVRARKVAFAPAAETIWHTDQIRRLSRGRAPLPARRPSLALGQYFATATADALLRRFLIR